jgi:polysaccharide biosynthesis/export protein
MRHWHRRMLLVKIGLALGLGAAGVGCQTASHTSAPLVALGAPVGVPESTGQSITRVTARAVAPPETTPVVWNSVDTNLPPLENTSTEQPAEGSPPVVDNVAKVLPRGDLEPKQVPEKKRDEPELSPPHILPSPPPVVTHEHHVGPPHELDKRALPPYQIAPPDILLVEVLSKEGLLKNDQPIRGQHLVRLDGTIGLGIYGSVFVGGMTFDEAREAVAAHLRNLPGRNLKVESKDVSVDCLAFNSHFYYVITDGGGFGEQVYPFPITGSETVLDAIGRVNGIPAVGDKYKVWVARRGPGSSGQKLPVDWNSIAQMGGTETNYQLMPGDRVYVKADHWVSADSWLSKRLAPIDRIFGATLLGSQAVNSIRNRNSSGNNNP